MPFCCPLCQETTNQLGNCSQSKCLPTKFGVLRILEPAFQHIIIPYETRFKTIRASEGISIKNTSIYERLPFIGKKEKEFLTEFIGFQQDLKIIKNLLNDKSNLRILNHGSWNGWLSNHLVKWGHQVTAISYFMDEFDGLGAQQFYKNNWLSIQMDIEHDLSILNEKYDCIIINRGIAFLTDPLQTIQTLIGMLNESGMLIITGVKIFQNPKIVEKIFQNHIRHFKEKYNFELLFRPTKGFLTKKDQQEIQKMDVSFHPYPKKRLHNLRSMLIPTKPYFCYGLYVK
ncbi:MAG: class I SAM-dependent methyltransferase [Saprospiraceae bacterium]